MKILSSILLFFCVVVTVEVSAQSPGIKNVIVSIGKTEFRGWSDSKMMLTLGYENIENGQLTPIAKYPQIEKWNSNKMREYEFLLECDDEACLDSLRSNLGYIEISLSPSLKSDLTFQCELKLFYNDKAGEKKITWTHEIRIPRGSPTFKVNWSFNENTTGEEHNSLNLNK